MVQLSDLQTIMRELPRLDRQGLRLRESFYHDPITEADFEAFDVAVQFLRPLWIPALAQLNQPVGPLPGPGGMTSDILARRAERFAALCGRELSIPNGVMIAAISHLEIPNTNAHRPGSASAPILGPVVKAALDDHRAAADIMQKAPEPLTGEEAKVLAILALHGIDAPDGQIKRVFLAPRPDQIACIYNVPGTMWLRTETLLPIGRAVKLGLEYLFEASK